jgi:hypothetical protein
MTGNPIESEEMKKLTKTQKSVLKEVGTNSINTHKKFYDEVK